MQYACGCCCQTTITKSVPLDKIQDVNIISDCCGDCCGCSEGPNQPYKMYVQTAGQSNPVAELSTFCIENVADFRAKVLAAKRALGGSSSSSAAGAGKDGEGGWVGGGGWPRLLGITLFSYGSWRGLRPPSTMASMS